MNALSRGVRSALAPAAIVLPAWLLIGWTVFGHGVWGFIGLLIVAGVSVLALLLLSAVLALRPSVRATGLLRPVEVVLLLSIAIGLVWLGFWGPSSGIGAAIAIAAYLAAFWAAIAAFAAEFRAGARPGAATRPGDVIDIGEITVVEEDGSQDDTR